MSQRNEENAMRVKTSVKAGSQKEELEDFTKGL